MLRKGLDLRVDLGLLGAKLVAGEEQKAHLGRSDADGIYNHQYTCLGGISEWRREKLGRTCPSPPLGRLPSLPKVVGSRGIRCILGISAVV